MIKAIESAHGIIIATPMYQAAYSGMLKCCRDILPQFAPAGDAILPVGNGGRFAFVLALDYALRPVPRSMAVRHNVQSQFVAEASMRIEAGSMTIDADAAARCGKRCGHFAHRSATPRRAAP